MIEEAAIDEELERLAADYIPLKRPWLPEDEVRLEKFYGRVSPRDLARLLKRSRMAIMKKAQAMGLTDPPHSGPD